MRKTLLFFVTIFSISFSQAQNPFWTRGNAFTVPYKKLELNVLSPSKYGITRKSELSLHPLAFFVMPHVFYKQKWTKLLFLNRTLYLSSRHGIYYPTAALKNSVRFNFDFLPHPTGTVPGDIAIQNEAIFSMFLDEPSQCSSGDKLISARLGFKYSFKFNDTPFPTINRAILYRETVVGTPALVWYTTARIDAHLNSYFNYFAEAEFYSQGFFKNISIEAKAGLMGYSGKRSSSFGGVKFAYSRMPGNSKFLVMPIFDVTFNINPKRKNKNEMSLFGEEIFKHDNSLDITGDENIKYRYEDNSTPIISNTKKESFFKRIFKKRNE
jgi:hypothetical protein